MKPCDQFLPELCAWLDGELNDSRELEAHLAECASCRAIAEQYRRIDTLLADVTPPANLHSHIMAGITASHSPKAKRRFAFKSATAVAACAAALLLVVGAGLITLPRWNGVGRSTEAAMDDAVVYAAEPAAAPVLNAASTVSKQEAPAEVETVTMESAPMDIPADEPAAEPSADEPAGAPMLSVDTAMTAVNTDTKTQAADTADNSYESVASPSDMLLYFEEELEEPVEAPAEEAAEAPADGADYMVNGNAQAEVDLESVKLAVAAGEQLSWTISGTAIEDLPFMLRDNVEFVRVGEEALWLGSLDSESVLELFTILAEDLGGVLATSDNETGSIVLDCR